jgi:hypothetical protein
MRRLVLVAGIACLLVASTSSAAGTARFSGYVGGGVTGAGHQFYVGDGLFLVFVDSTESFTPYRVCWHRLHRAHHRCWSGETGPAGKKDRIFAAAPQGVGPYLVKWTVRGHRKAAWRFDNGTGD